jgi:hypothetical protein
MYCLPIDDLCHIDQDYKAKVAEIAQQEFRRVNRFVLGTFNGREFVYTWFGKTPVIIIYVVGRPISDEQDMLIGR